LWLMGYCFKFGARMSRLRGQRSCSVFERLRVCIPDWRPVIQEDVFGKFPQSLHKNAQLTQIKPQQLIN
jgi:hypothetical protein